MGNIIGVVAKTKLLNIFDIFNAMKGDSEQKKKKKKNIMNEISNEELNFSESFLKQTEILKQILNKMFSDMRDDTEVILIKIKYIKIIFS